MEIFVEFANLMYCACKIVNDCSWKLKREQQNQTFNQNIKQINEKDTIEIFNKIIIL